MYEPPNDKMNNMLALYQGPRMHVSTVRLPPGIGYLPFETGVSHADYKSSGVIVVEAYETEQAALLGHQRWVFSLSIQRPMYLKDVGNWMNIDLAHTYGEPYMWLCTPTTVCMSCQTTVLILSEDVRLYQAPGRPIWIAEDPPPKGYVPICSLCASTKYGVELD